MMNSSLRYEIDECINEINSIVRQLRQVANDIEQNISGMNTGKYTRGLETSADKYKKAADKLRKIR